MSNHSEICPVCKGAGKYKEYTNYSCSIYSEHTCHGCNGKGWIIISEKFDSKNFSDVMNHIPSIE